MIDHKLSRTESRAAGIRIACTTVDGVEMGHAYIYCIPNESRQKPYALLEDVFVSESERGKGVGNMLLEEAIAVAKNHGCYKILGTSRFERESVHAWYVRKGFEKFGYEFRMNLE